MASCRKDLKEKNYPYTRVCSDHFIGGAPCDIYDTTNHDWAPSQRLGYTRTAAVDVSRYDRRASRSRKRQHIEAATICDSSDAVTNETVTDDDDDDGNATSRSVQTTLTSSKILVMENGLREMEKEIREFSGATLTYKSFETNDAKVRYYTGLPSWHILLALHVYVEAALFGQHCRLSSFQQLMLTLMRLRLGLHLEDLSYRFGICLSTASRIFTHTIDVLFLYLKVLIKWPERDVLRATLPLCFVKHSPSCVVIIDCFEVFLERPCSLLARAQTFSSYKHHNTVKYLIGITPQGSVSFISQGWGGRVSDKRLTENCGLLDNLLPGDTILADRGFDIKESVGLYCARIQLPAYTRGKKQLEAISIEQTRNIANVRIHVERVIGLLRQKYSILSATHPIDSVRCTNDSTPQLDKIVNVCCGLVNMNDSVVPFD